ncbi:hypothetical protein Ciccas_004670 [Cichlidogyrus casuarinus]|uniref:mitogen-activated protein kinase kinase n=1 Tax=Cichlidogyrus casuarinus TaxID=1844966 RepID=A0ABD2QBN7_9PLAT
MPQRPTLQGISLKPNKNNESSFCKESYNQITIPGKCDQQSMEVMDLQKICQIGVGSFGFVNKTRHIPTGHIMAVKWIRSTLNKNQEVAALKDLDVVKQSLECPYIVKFYGALFHEGSCLICMELLSSSLEEFYKIAHRCLREIIPEDILGKIVVATILALDYLKSNLKVIHRGWNIWKNPSFFA